MNITIQELILEVTRRCNMCCGHCLRGDAQNLDMSKEIVDQVLSQVSRIESVTFTGGEPSLNLELIHYFFTRAEELDKLPEWFYLVTNGKTNQEELALELLKWYPKMAEQEYCGVALSIDEWHDPVENDNSILHGLVFYRHDKELEDGALPIREGRAEKLSPQNTSQELDVRVNAAIFPYTFDNGYYVDMLYVSADGECVGDCDMSYEHIHEYSQGNIRDLETILKDAERRNEGLL